MATYSTDELAHKVLAVYVRDRPAVGGQVLSQQDLLAQWPKGFTHVELTAALEHACRKGWLKQTEAGFALTERGVAEP